MGSSRRRQLCKDSGPSEEPLWESKVMQKVQDFIQGHHKDQTGFITRSDMQVKDGTTGILMTGCFFFLISFILRSCRRRISHAAQRSWSSSLMGWMLLALGS